jgi:hypothetical protein
MKKTLLALALLALTTAPALATDNPWSGTWKLNVVKSQFTGDTFTYSKAANGMMHYSDGSVVSYDFGIDGKEYKTVYGRTTMWTAAGNNAWDSVYKGNGTILSKTHRELSADGKTLTITSTGTKPDGSKFNDVVVYSRVTGTNGLAGKWRSTKVDVSAPDMWIISSPSPDVLHWDIPGYKETVEGKLDGTDLPVSGPTVPAGLTFGIKKVAPRKLSYVVKVSGKVDTYGVQTLAADGKSFTDVSWSPGKQTEKSTAVFEKQ